ncbi:MAG TPA: response regulator [Paracoccaceae bacterium]|nr:response regulator [Paracoccaceae bacterium]
MADAPVDQGFKERLSNLRHDLRTPVGHIMGYAELIQEDMDPETLKDCGHDLQAIHEAGQRLLAMIDQFFGESKRSPDQIDIHDAQFHMRMQMNHIAGYTEMLREDALEDGREDLLGDLDHIRDAQVLVVHMLENVGAALFDDTDAAPRKRKDAAATGNAPVPTIAGIGGEILVVDDDPANRELLTRRLERGGYVAVTADSGQAALDLLEERPFDLILLDQMMPGLSGMETLQAIKKSPVRRNIPVIMLSAADDQSIVIQCMLSGAEDYVAKPFNPVLLTARINACLEKVRLRRSAARQIKVFISSPGDVIPERQVVKTVLGRLNDEFSGRALMIPILWEEEPLLASDTFQAQIHPPRETEIYIGILWSRIGSPLPDSIRRDDGSQYESGSIFEFEDALQGYRANGYPEMLLYRKDGAPVISLQDRAKVLDSLDQMDKLQSYIEANLMGEDGTYASAFHMFDKPEQFETMVEMHLRKLVERLLSQDVRE